jgi:hypothetical protein
MRRISNAICTATFSLLFAVGTVAQGELIDFESGFARLDPVVTVSTASNVVTFSTMGLDNTQPFIAQVGSSPKDAFEKNVGGVIIGDTPEGGNPGRFFLTDGAGNSNNFLFDLAQPVSQFSLDLYDFVGDGGAQPLDSATLRAYSDPQRTSQVAFDMYTVPRPRPADGLAVTLSVSAPTIAALMLEFSTFDRGTGIDNIQFRTVPEPGTLVLALFAVLCTGGYLRHLRRHR